MIDTGTLVIYCFVYFVSCVAVGFCFVILSKQIDAIDSRLLKTNECLTYNHEVGKEILHQLNMHSKRWENALSVAMIKALANETAKRAVQPGAEEAADQTHTEL